MNQTEEEQAVHLSEYYRLLMRKKWVIIISLVFMVGIVLRYNSRLVPIYSATATLIIDKEASRSPITGQPANYETYLSESLTFNTHFEMIKSRPVLEQVIDDMQLDQMSKKQVKEELVEINPLKQFVSRFKNNVFLFKA